MPTPSADPLAATRHEVDEMIRRANDCAPFWTTPCAPGKWSPSQVVEHAARGIEETGKDMRGERALFPHLPKFLRPLARRFLLRRVVKNESFPRARTNKAMDPTSGPESPRAAAARLEAAWEVFASAHRALAARGSEMESQTFGRVTIADYVKFQEVHTRHHRAQMRAPESG